MSTYAIIKTGGKQVKVEVGQAIYVEKINAEAGSEVRGTQSQKYAEIPGFPDRKSDDQRCGKEGWKCRKPVQRRKRLYPGQWKRRSVRARLLKRDVSRSGKSRR